MVTIRMKVFPQKRKELSLTIASLVGLIRKENGCKRCDFCYNAEDENELSLAGEWESKEDLNRHMQSEIFRVLLGAMSLLKEPQELKLYGELSANGYLNLAGEVNASRSNI